VKVLGIQQDQVVFVDNEDYERCKTHLWIPNHGCVLRHEAGKVVYLCDFILGCPAEYTDGDEFNNTKSNLRKRLML